MKKILFTFVLSIIGFIGFSSADSLVISCPANSRCTPDINFPSSMNVCIDFSDYGGQYNLDYYIKNSPDGIVGGTIYFSEGTNYCFNGEGVWFENALSDSSTVKLSYYIPVISNGTSTFIPIINGLTTSINEFIPYVAYIGLGLLGVIIGFVAIKRLMNWIRAKVLGTFSSGKRK